MVEVQKSPQELSFKNPDQVLDYALELKNRIALELDKRLANVGHRQALMEIRERGSAAFRFNPRASNFEIDFAGNPNKSLTINCGKGEDFGLSDFEKKVLLFEFLFCKYSQKVFQLLAYLQDVEKGDELGYEREVIPGLESDSDDLQKQIYDLGLQIEDF
jgi:hypothetical protein